MKICIKCFNIFKCFGICMIWYIQCFLKIMHEVSSRVFIFIHVPLFIKIILNCKYYKNFPYFYNACNKKKRKLDLGVLFFKLLLITNLKNTKNTILGKIFKK